MGLIFEIIFLDYVLLTYVDPVLCTVLPNRSSPPVICLRNRGPLKVLNDSIRILDCYMTKEATQTHLESM